MSTKLFDLPGFDDGELTFPASWGALEPSVAAQEKEPAREPSRAITPEDVRCMRLALDHGLDGAGLQVLKTRLDGIEHSDFERQLRFIRNCVGDVQLKRTKLFKEWRVKRGRYWSDSIGRTPQEAIQKAYDGLVLAGWRYAAL